MQHANANIDHHPNPCTDKLTDLEYLEHMIPHHQVAIDMSHMLQKTNESNPTMLHLCRDIVRKQDYEIWEMSMMKRRLSEPLFRASQEETIRAHPKSASASMSTKMELYNPFVGQRHCNPLFFDPDAHEHHMAENLITSKTYLEHMIPHHQVAIDMSRRLLLHTNHSYLIDFCRKLIIDQQYEIVVMKDLLKSTYRHHSALV